MLVSSVIELSKKAVGGCNNTIALDYIQRALDLLQQEGNFDPQLGYMDICTQECVITLPDEVDIPMAINIGGSPSDFRNKWFEFHLNGPGSECCGSSCNFAWEDIGSFGSFRDPYGESALTAVSSEASDGNAVKNLLVYGYTATGQWVMTDKGDGVLTDGMEVPIYTTLVQANAVGAITRITKIVSPGTDGFISVYSYATGSTTNILVGFIKPWETEPFYRRIRLHGTGTNLLVSSCSSPATGCTTWVRMRFRRKQYQLRSLSDFLFLSSSNALFFAIKAVKKYEADLLDEGEKYMAKAIYCLERKEKINNGPNRRPLQVKAPGFAGASVRNMV